MMTKTIQDPLPALPIKLIDFVDLIPELEAAGYGLRLVVERGGIVLKWWKQGSGANVNQPERKDT